MKIHLTASWWVLNVAQTLPLPIERRPWRQLFSEVEKYGFHENDENNVSMCPLTYGSSASRLVIYAVLALSHMRITTYWRYLRTFGRFGGFLGFFCVS